ncbi:MAG: hypothetical protein GX675_01255 [Erysipelotrichaceae bacterium]|nr:hypothetical protein [Erysipelotrichaceae bacterium]
MDFSENNSYVKLYRKLEKWEWYLDVYTTKLFIHCLIKANWEDKKWKGIVIKRGQFVTSLSSLAKESGLSIRNVRTSLKRLESTQEVTKLTTSKYTIITVLNYGEYQTNDKVSDKQVTNKRQTNDKQVTTTKEYKEYKELKEDKEYIYIGEFENVKLTQEEIDKLKNSLGNSYEDFVERLSNYMASTGKKYKSHYATILNWHRKDLNTPNNNSNTKNYNNNLTVIEPPSYMKKSNKAIDPDDLPF